jgi:hypothetical protein
MTYYTYYLLSVLVLMVLVIGLLPSTNLWKKLIFYTGYSSAFFCGIILFMGLTIAYISKAYSEELAVEELKFRQVQRGEPTCDPDDDGCNTEK